MATDGVASAVGTTTRLSWEDIVIVVAYFVAVIIVGIYASCKATRSNVSGYFLAGRSMLFFTVGASLFVSNIGSEHFIGLAGSGAAGGIGVGAWEFNAILLIQLLGFVFVPVYIASQVYTMPEYMNKRFGGQRIRVYFAILSLVLYIFTKCSVNLYTGALFIQQSLGWDLYLSILLQIGIVAVLTVTGGLTAVIYTDTLQAVLMIGGALSLMAKGFYDIGGFNELWRRYPLAVTNYTVPNTTCHEINPNWNVMLRNPSDPEMPWPGFLFGQTPGSIWYWCSDQVIVQRALAAKSLSHAQGATILAGFAKILPLFMMVLPGMIARVLYTDEVACVDPKICWETCQSYTGCSNIAYPKLVLGIMPKGARGVMMAVMLAALMSDLDSIFNSASTMFTIDIYKPIRPKAGVKELMIIGRLFVVVMAGIAIAWVPVVKETQGGQVFIYIQEVSLYLSPPVACIYLLAVLWPRCNEKGAFWGLMAGFVTGVTRLILVFIYRGPDKCGDIDTRPSILADLHYMYFAILLFWLTFAVAVVVSLLTEPPTYKQTDVGHVTGLPPFSNYFLIFIDVCLQLYKTTFWTRYDKVDIEKDRVHTVWDRLSCCFYSTVQRDSETQTDTDVIRATAVTNPRDSGSINNCVLTRVVGCDEVPTINGGSTETTVLGNNVVELSVVDVKRSVYSEHTLEDDQPRHVYIEPPVVQQTSVAGQRQRQTWKQFMFSWICGISEASEQDENENRLAREREERICSLEQDWRVKILLHFLLVVILAIGVALYCFFSLWGYTVPPGGPDNDSSN